MERAKQAKKENYQWKNESKKKYDRIKKITGVNTPVLNWLLFSMLFIYLFVL